jgi:hypothetical protein
MIFFEKDGDKYYLCKEANVIFKLDKNNILTMVPYDSEYAKSIESSSKKTC